MNLIIDVGNTLIKLAVFDKNLLISKTTSFQEDFMDDFQNISNKNKNINNVIISSVGTISKEDILKIKKKYKTLLLSNKTIVPFINKYKTPETLGVDRIALVSSAAIQYPNKNVLIIDVGSCITYDFLNVNNEYIGGAISPGLELRYKSLNDYTDKLPLLVPITTNNLIGNTTDSSIHIGVIQGVVNEIKGFISSYKEEYEEFTIILTGGGSQYLVDSLKNDIFANSNFLLEGLNYILENNKK